MAQAFQERLQAESSAGYEGHVTPEKILVAVQRIVEMAKPWRVVAFGSRARGDHRVDSDLDLAVVVESYRPQSGLPPVNRTDTDVWMPLDLVVYDLARERDLSDCLNTLQSVIRQEGVLLYDRTSGIVDRGIVERLV